MEVQNQDVMGSLVHVGPGFDPRLYLHDFVLIHMKVSDGPGFGSRSEPGPETRTRPDAKI